jgi:hypothetical protein
MTPCLSTIPDIKGVRCELGGIVELTLKVHDDHAFASVYKCGMSECMNCYSQVIVALAERVISSEFLNRPIDCTAGE